MGNTASDLQFDGDVRTTLQTLEDQVKKDAKGVVADLGAVGLKASIYDAQDVITYFTQLRSGEVDDRDMRQEKLMSWLFKLPLTPKSAFGSTLERAVINSLWTSLPHPYPSWSHMPGPQYRSADGSGNNPDQPSVGIAGGHYIRDVPVPRTLSAPRELPDPEVVFEKLFKRRTADEGGFRAHPCGTSAHMFYFATLVTHDLFNTDATNRFHNTTTGYVDLAWLYGWNQDMQDSVRDKAGGRGKLYPDVFSDARMGVQPPGLVAWALLWNRNHNWIAEQLLIHGKDDARFATIPSASDTEGTKLLDEHLFQTARLINGNTFVTAVLKDYVKQLLGVNREKTAWTLPIAADFSSLTEANIPEATGNQCSIEFNFIYRWHSALSQEDERWVNGLFQKLRSKKSAEELGEDQKDAVPTSDLTREHHSRREQNDPRTRIYFPLDPDVRRDAKTQKFPDSALAGFINQATSYHAGAFGGRQVPAIFKSIEIDGIRHGRELGTCTLNELRRLCHLRPYRSFLEMNADPTISASLRSLYGHPDNVELYPGLVAEQAKARQSGTGLCAGRTITYAILADAVALVRGDRFLTREWNEGNLTRWGFAETQADNNNLSFGNVLGDKLLNRHLGDELMPRDSVKTQYSFSVPEESITNVKAFGMGNLFRETRGEQNGKGEAKLHTTGEGSW